jgi:hypothetical protein
MMRMREEAVEELSYSWVLEKIMGTTKPSENEKRTKRKRSIKKVTLHYLS